MTQTNTSITGSINKGSVIKAMLMGAGIGLLVILFFVTGTETQPHWPNLWKIRPLIITPLAGAIGGGLFFIATQVLKRQGLNGAIAVFISLIGFLVALWLGIVLGLAETLWD